MEENEQKVASYETMLNWIMEYLHEEKILSTSKVQAKAMWNTLVTICEDKLQASLDDMVKDIECSCAQIAAYFVEESNIESVVDDVLRIIRDRSITYFEGLNKICLIINRDRNSFVAHSANNHYGYVLNK